MIVATFVNGVLDVNILNTALVCMGVGVLTGVVTCIVYFCVLVGVAIITGR